MAMDMKNPDLCEAIRVLRSPMTELEITRSSQPDAAPEEVAASASSCVVHLCGCR